MNTIKETVKQAQFGTRWAVKRYIKIMENDLARGEEILAMAAPFDRTTE